MVALVGYSGFVGSNLYSRARNRIKGVFNSQNIERAYGLEPDSGSGGEHQGDQSAAACADLHD